MPKITLLIVLAMALCSWGVSQDLEHSQGFWFITKASDGRIEKVDWDDLVVLTPEHAIVEKQERKEYMNFKFTLTYQFTALEAQLTKLSNAVKFNDKIIYHDRIAQIAESNERSIEFYLNPYQEDGTIITGETTLAIVLNEEGIVAEKEMDNNTQKIRIVFDGFSPLTLPLPDLQFAKDFVLINNKEVKFEDTITLTEEDIIADVKSPQGYPAFALSYFVLSEQIGDISEFTNEIYQGKNIVAIQKDLTTEGKILQVNVALFLNTEQNEPIVIYLDALNGINESKEDNNSQKIIVKFSGFTKIDNTQINNDIKELFKNISEKDLTPEQISFLGMMSERFTHEEVFPVVLNRELIDSNEITFPLTGGRKATVKITERQTIGDSKLLRGQVNNVADSAEFFVQNNEVSGFVEFGSDIFTVGHISEETHVIAKVKQEFTESVKKLKKMAMESYKNYLENYQKAVEIALEKGWTIYRKFPDGKTILLRGIDSSGQPIYIETLNSNASSHTNINSLWPQDNNFSQSGESWNLTGQGINIGVWDGGLINRNHQELQGRVFWQDQGETFDVGEQIITVQVDDHASHVAGTLIASGIGVYDRYEYTYYDKDKKPRVASSPYKGSVRGGAFQATVQSYAFYADEPEIIAEVSGGLILSNHSYALTKKDESGNKSQYSYEYINKKINKETNEVTNKGSNTEEYDEIIVNAPHQKYLAVFAAGNARDDNGEDEDEVNYKTISSYACAKNVLSVGSLDPNNKEKISSFSDFGPTEGGRIKPDIMGIGGFIISCHHTNNNGALGMGGTSMAAPNVCGALALLQELYRRINGQFMNSATLKAVVIHTADDLGEVGPDYKTGWGRLNALKASNIIAGNGMIVENNGELFSESKKYTQTIHITSANQPLKVTICWIDPAGKTLVHNLNLKVSGNGETHLPWILDPDNPSVEATTGINTRDNVEQVFISSVPIGTYTIEVSLPPILDPLPETPLQQGQLAIPTFHVATQPFSLIISHGKNHIDLTNQSITSAKLIEANNLVTASNCNLESGSIVKFNAGSKIIFKPGFFAKNGSKMTAKIDPNLK